ncbi:beta-ketoacyl-[acyl-carrier-protein] synthase family protein, partial [Sulfurimonas sp. SAG-AH-194-I05]|nr:beta-ketoacyl-[acyl-carrier-protein] synthase family protein [Sulfurimonas sp. SAG-AH-194-I05]
TIFGFASLGILSDEVCTPFQHKTKGMNVSEGIGALLLQNERQKNSIELIGAGTSSDAYHIANPDSTAMGAITAMQNALDDAALNASDIDYINAHGTGTNANDTMEAKAIQHLFSQSVYVSSSKANLGHTLGAAGAIEAIICVESLQKSIIFPQLRCDKNEAKLNLVNIKKEMPLKYALSNSFAFGGNNTSLIFGVCHEN